MSPEPGRSLELSFFLGCSLATTAKESCASLLAACRRLGLVLREVDDWNCCGTSSAHALDRRLALELAARNLSLAEPGRPLLVACPSCFKNLRAGQKRLARRPDLKAGLEGRWGRSISPGLKIISFLEIIHFLLQLKGMDAYRWPDGDKRLSGLKIAPYYGCMLAAPRGLRRQKGGDGMLEKSLASFGAEMKAWSFRDRCCGTFLAAARPEVVTPLVNRIMQGASASGADCVVTACAMCQLNLEIRCTEKNGLPVLHFTEVLALALGKKGEASWWARHLTDPRPLLSRFGLA